MIQRMPGKTRRSWGHLWDWSNETQSWLYPQKCMFVFLKANAYIWHTLQPQRSHVMLLAQSTHRHRPTMTNIWKERIAILTGLGFIFFSRIFVIAWIIRTFLGWLIYVDITLPSPKTKKWKTTSQKQLSHNQWHMARAARERASPGLDTGP